MFLNPLLAPNAGDARASTGQGAEPGAAQDVQVLTGASGAFQAEVEVEVEKGPPDEVPPNGARVEDSTEKNSSTLAVGNPTSIPLPTPSEATTYRVWERADRIESEDAPAGPIADVSRQNLSGAQAETLEVAKSTKTEDGQRGTLIGQRTGQVDPPLPPPQLESNRTALDVSKLVVGISPQSDPNAERAVAETTAITPVRPKTSPQSASDPKAPAPAVREIVRANGTVAPPPAPKTDVTKPNTDAAAPDKKPIAPSNNAPAIETPITEATGQRGNEGLAAGPRTPDRPDASPADDPTRLALPLPKTADAKTEQAAAPRSDTRLGDIATSGPDSDRGNASRREMTADIAAQGRPPTDAVSVEGRVLKAPTQENVLPTAAYTAARTRVDDVARQPIQTRIQRSDVEPAATAPPAEQFTPRRFDFVGETGKDRFEHDTVPRDAKHFPASGWQTQASPAGLHPPIVNGSVSQSLPQLGLDALPPVLDNMTTDASVDPDILRFDLAGREQAVLQTTAYSRLEPARPTVVMAQVADAARTIGEGQVEITLVPEELGRVRLTMTPSEAGLAVSIFAERPETLELMRRNIELLARDLTGQGFENLSFSFGGSGAGADGSAPDQRTGMDAIDWAIPSPSDDVTAVLTPRTEGGLDLRL